jgi:cyanophycinase
VGEVPKSFSELGVVRLEHLHVDRREELLDGTRYEVLDNASVLFFTGGEQIKITSKFGGTPLCTRMREIYEAGATIAGTSSGASVMSEVTMAGGEEQSSKVATTLRLAPGLALAPGMIIDQHFGERGRIGRLIMAVGQNPRLLGIGIDEDTAIVLKNHREFSVMGTAVFVVDGPQCGSAMPPKIWRARHRCTA